MASNKYLNIIKKKKKKKKFYNYFPFNNQTYKPNVYPEDEIEKFKTVNKIKTVMSDHKIKFMIQMFIFNSIPILAMLFAMHYATTIYDHARIANYAMLITCLITVILNSRFNTECKRIAIINALKDKELSINDVWPTGHKGP